MRHYHHLTYSQRCHIHALKSTGCSLRTIAKQLGVSPSTISREMTRNSHHGGYDEEQAHQLACKRRQLQGQYRQKLTGSLLKRVIRYVKKKWSPEHIAGYLKKQSIAISHETIYRFIWKNKAKGECLYKNLRRSGKKYNKQKGKSAGRGCIPNRVDIDQRPAIVDKKTRFGDLEADLIIGAKHEGALLTLVDRKSKYTYISLLENKKADGVAKAIVQSLKSIKKSLKTITFDNGKEFAHHEIISKKLGVSCYFAKPYHSWERGLNEHTNGLIRQYFPKSMSFRNLTQKAVKKVQEYLNNRPRKVLNYRTLQEIFLEA